jgi:galactokinase
MVVALKSGLASSAAAEPAKQAAIKDATRYRVSILILSSIQVDSERRIIRSGNLIFAQIKKRR